MEKYGRVRIAGHWLSVISDLLVTCYIYASEWSSACCFHACHCFIHSIACSIDSAVAKMALCNKKTVQCNVHIRPFPIYLKLDITDGLYLHSKVVISCVNEQKAVCATRDSHTPFVCLWFGDIKSKKCRLMCRSVHSWHNVVRADFSSAWLGRNVCGSVSKYS